MINVLLLLIAFIALAHLLCRVFQLPLQSGPAVTASLIILCLYAADFFGALNYTAWALHIIGYLYLCFLICEYFFKRPTTSLAHWLFRKNGDSLILFALLGSGLYPLVANAAFSSWDEFSHWGTVIRAIFEAETFHFDVTPLYFQDYPPGISLFAYYVLIFTGYAEGNVFFAINLLLLSFMIPLLPMARRVGVPYLFATISVLYYLIAVMGSGWTSALIDQILAVLFAGSIVVYYEMRSQRGAIWMVALMLGALALSKHAGQSFALLVAGIVLLDAVILRLATGTFKSRQGIIDASVVFILVVFPIILMSTWNHHVENSGYSSSLGGMSTSSFFKKSLSCCSEPREVEVAGRFFAAAFDRPPPETNEVRKLPEYAIGLFETAGIKGILIEINKFSPVFAWIFLTVISIATSLYFSSRVSKARFLALSLILSIGYVLYGFSLLLFYLYGFSDYEARNLASLHRYISVFSLAWIIILIYMFAAVLADRQPKAELCSTKFIDTASKNVAIFSLFFLLFIVFTPPKDKAFLIYGAPSALSAQRADIQDWTKSISEKIPKDARIFIVWQGSNGRELWIIRYEMLPRPANFNCYSLGKPISKEDIYTCDVGADELRKMFSGYDYVIVGKGLHSLQTQFNSIFDELPTGIDRAAYKVLKVNGVVSLELVFEEPGGVR